LDTPCNFPNSNFPLTTLGMKNSKFCIFLLVLLCYVSKISATFMMSSAGACNCAPAPACPHVLPCAAVARADTTHEQASQKLLDDLELVSFFCTI
jgi:hypothetical protein